ncbi:hypothetical protein QN277_023807 [Acacia crassicarpa]|uniref:Uncharacterized protein n=1 Tax=Acacia crassicarpa TaxID=499986 RepID=A0AAE1MJF1_9FABA|nr:hypothetical protein QN277_023807 [Acacia crassicarpa]
MLKPVNLSQHRDTTADASKYLITTAQGPKQNTEDFHAKNSHLGLISLVNKLGCNLENMHLNCFLGHECIHIMFYSVSVSKFQRT